MGKSMKLSKQEAAAFAERLTADSSGAVYGSVESLIDWIGKEATEYISADCFARFSSVSDRAPGYGFVVGTPSGPLVYLRVHTSGSGVLRIGRITYRMP